MATFAPIQYRDFWDVPRLFLVDVQGSKYLFDCGFDEAVEDFANEYSVYRMPTDFVIPDRDWSGLPKQGTRVGIVSVDQVRFDPTRRESVDTSALSELLGAPRGSVARSGTGRSREPGLLKGSILYMADDFDAPLDEMREYME